MTFKADRWKNLLGAARVFMTDFERRWKNFPRKRERVHSGFVANRAGVHSDFGAPLKKFLWEIAGLFIAGRGGG